MGTASGHFRIVETLRLAKIPGRIYSAYRINPSLSQPIRARLQALSKGEHVSLLSTPDATILEENQNQAWRKECPNCGIITSSVIARYCEACGRPLKMKCASCGTVLDAIYKYCLNCGAKAK